MFAYVKNPPTTYVLHYQNGRVRREGPGLAFWYFLPSSTIVRIPLASRDVPFAFSEITADFQPVTLQGQLTYRVVDAKRLASLLDFSVRPTGQYVSDDPEKVPERLVQTAQIFARAVVQRLTLREALVSSDTIVTEVVAALREAEPVRMLGVEILALTVVAIKPTPDIARALEADAREGLQGKADEAIYTRRKASVEQERRIKESELETEIAVQEKQRQIRETQDRGRYFRRRAALGAGGTAKRERTSRCGRSCLHAACHAGASPQRRLAHPDGAQRRRRGSQVDGCPGVPRARGKRGQDR